MSNAEGPGMTAIPDDKLFTYGDRVKGKVVIITGARLLSSAPTLDNADNSPFKGVLVVLDESLRFALQNTGEPLHRD